MPACRQRYVTDADIIWVKLRYHTVTRGSRPTDSSPPHRYAVPASVDRFLICYTAGAFTQDKLLLARYVFSTVAVSPRRQGLADNVVAQKFAELRGGSIRIAPIPNPVIRTNALSRLAVRCRSVLERLKLAS